MINYEQIKVQNIKKKQISIQDESFLIFILSGKTN